MKKTYQIEVSDDAADVLNDMKIRHRVKPENVIKIMVEGALADALTDCTLRKAYIQEGRQPQETTKYAWRNAKEIVAIDRQRRAA